MKLKILKEGWGGKSYSTKVFQRDRAFGRNHDPKDRYDEKDDPESNTPEFHKERMDHYAALAKKFPDPVGILGKGIHDSLKYHTDKYNDLTKEKK